MKCTPYSCCPMRSTLQHGSMALHFNPHLMVRQWALQDTSPSVLLQSATCVLIILHSHLQLSPYTRNSLATWPLNYGYRRDSSMVSSALGWAAGCNAQRRSIGCVWCLMCFAALNYLLCEFLTLILHVRTYHSAFLGYFDGPLWARIWIIAN